MAGRGRSLVFAVRNHPRSRLLALSLRTTSRPMRRKVGLDPGAVAFRTSREQRAPHRFVGVHHPEFRLVVRVDAQEVEDQAMGSRRVFGQVVVHDHADALTTESREVPVDLVGIARYGPVLQGKRLATTGGDPPPEGAVAFRLQCLGEIPDVLVALIEHLAVLRVHLVDRVAQHDDDPGVRREVADLPGGLARVEVEDRVVPAVALPGVRRERRQVVREPDARRCSCRRAEAQVGAEVVELPGGHEHVGMLAQVGGEGSGPGLRGSHQKEVGSRAGAPGWGSGL